MNIVYVRWYGNVLQGELLDGETMGMKQVRIPLGGHHPVALFTPGHVYASEEQISATVPKSSQIVPKSSEVVPKSSEVVPKAEITDILPADDRAQIEAFKQANWDHGRGHLRIDKLDEFYQLWRMAMVPFGFVEAVPQGETTLTATQPQKPETDSEALRINTDEITARPQRDYGSRPTRRNAVKKAVQLSLFD